MTSQLRSTKLLLILTCALSRAPRKVYVVHDDITAMTVEPDGTVLYLAGGKHIKVREHPADIWQGLVHESVRSKVVEQNRTVRLGDVTVTNVG